MSLPFEIKIGTAHPLGAVPDAEGVNFSLFSESASAVELLLFDAHDDVAPLQVISLDPECHRTFHFWHVYVKGARPGIHYVYRVDGPSEVGAGHRFDKEKALLDPYARGLTDTVWVRVDACRPGDNLATSLRGVVIDPDTYDWEGDRSPHTPMRDSIIYEMHVKGFTCSKTSGVKHPGTFLGVIEKIPYLKELGVTAVELLPVFQYDAKEVLREMDDGRTLLNYWGYSTAAFFAPHGGYCVNPEQGNQLTEFRDMVKALHKAGIEVILDVVYNHTNEGNHQGPTFSFRGIDNRLYYHLVQGNLQYYMDYSGCGNTLNCNHPVVEKFITESLEFWVKEMHVDGFRFDEGSILSRGEDGAPMPHAPVLWNIELMDSFADIKLIAEAWDAAGLYQIGSFPGYRWAEWNGRYRDTIRGFLKGDAGLVGEVAARISGSADIYQRSGRGAENSINFVTCHDGFTLNDLVSYAQKHNAANGEENRDGINDNLSWNWGAEGATDDPEILRFRKQLMKNAAALLLLSQGVPMILGGDEMGRTQQGNNNAYCQDNEISWFDWRLLEENQDLFLFFKQMIALRKQCTSLRRGTDFGKRVNPNGFCEIEWHGCMLHAPGWNNPACRVSAFTLASFVEDEPDLHVMFNMDSAPLTFEVPKLNKGQWKRFADTALPSDEAGAAPGRTTVVIDGSYIVSPFSTVILSTV